MSERPTPQVVTLVLALGLGASLLVIAFLLGRESARAPAGAPRSAVPAPPVIEPEAAPADKDRGEPRWPAWADLDEWKGFDEIAVAESRAAAAAPHMEERADGTVLLSNRPPASDLAPTTQDAIVNPRQAPVSAYFLEMDTIQAESGAGDPNTFAMGMIKAGLGGSTAGFDQLVDDTHRMEEQIRRLAPPPSCAAYHEATLEALAKSRSLLEEMKSMFRERDFARLSSIAQRAGALQHQAKALQAMRRQIIATAQP